LAELTTEPKLLSRELWTADAMPLFQALAQPVAESMSKALAENLQSNLPEELASSMQSAGGLMRSVGAAMFAMQLGEAIGRLSTEVLTGGDIGLPIFQDQRAAFVPQNLGAFVDSFESDRDQTYIYLAVREMVHARLFKNSKWLRDYVVQQITAFSSGITIDAEKLAGLAEQFDPSDPSSLQAALESGALISEHSDDQKVALHRVETILALIEGWVEVVTEAATKLLPKSQAIGEAVRRRRATGGPAEKTFTTLVGLELRPRRQREATEMWRRITNEVGVPKRDGLWSHPDMLPTSADIDDPALLIAKLRAETGAIDAIDQMLIDLLNDEGPVDSAE
jgi:putative hydrolase